MKMKWYYYIPFWFLSVMSKTIRIFKIPAQDSTWEKYFGDGFTRKNFRRFLLDIKPKDKEMYWLMVVVPYMCTTIAIILFLALIFQVR